MRPEAPAAFEPIRLGALSFEVEHRGAHDPVRGEGGPTLRIRDGAGAELLRFDCFRRTPHYHVADAPEPTAYGPVRDPVSWAIDELRRDLAGYLKRAGHAGEDAWSEAEQDGALARAEAALRNPPARLDDLDVALLRTRLGEKWSEYPPDVLPAWVAEMDYPLAEPIRVVLERAVARSDLGYPVNPGDTPLRQCFADRMARLHGWSIDPARVEILSDVVQGLYVGLQAYSEPGDGAVIQTPIYPPFLSAVRDTGRRVIEHRFAPPAASGPGYPLDLDALGRVVDGRTRVLLLCNPHNPTGRVFTRDELAGIAAIARERDCVVLADEIHQDLVYDGRRHIPFATLDDDTASRTVTLTSATKAFNIPGLRCAVAHFGSRELHTRWNDALPRNTRGGIGLPGIYATVAAWEHADPWLDEVRTYLRDNLDFVASFVAREIPEIVFRPPEATYLAWLDCRALDLRPSPAQFLYRHARVALSEGVRFGEGFEGFARLNFATSRAILTEILERVAGAIRGR